MPGKALYFDLCAGIAGDMALAALLDLGASLGYVRKQVKAATPSQLAISTRQVSVSGIHALKLNVALKRSSPHQPHSHKDIVRILTRSSLDGRVREISLRIFEVLASAEAKIHGSKPGDVHFHEVGAWDSIADIVGTAAALCSLGVDQVFASRVPLGEGFVDTRHGRMPLPAPATLEILRGLPTYGTGLHAELTTPTGAAIIKALCSGFGPLPPLVVEATGWGAGTVVLPDRPNLLRAVLGTLAAPDSTAAGSDSVLGRGRSGGDPGDSLEGHDWLLETNIDDCSPLIVAHALDVLLKAGALDAWVTPIQMKKNRPAVQLSVLCSAQDRTRLATMVLTETTAIGLRMFPHQRVRLDRTMITVDTPLGPIPVKLALLEGKVVNRSPEFEDVKRAAETHGIPLKQAMALVAACVEKNK